MPHAVAIKDVQEYSLYEVHFSRRASAKYWPDNACAHDQCHKEVPNGTRYRQKETVKSGGNVSLSECCEKVQICSNSTGNR